MINVEFEVRKKNNDSVVRRVECKIKEFFNELTADDMQFICEHASKSVTETEMRLLLLRKWSNLSYEDFALLRENESALSELLKLVTIGFSDVETTKNLIPFFQFGGKKYTGLETYMGNIRMMQLALAENYFHLYLAGAKKEHLALLIETIYLVKGEDFNRYKINEDEPLFILLNETLQQAIFLNYAAMRKPFFRPYNRLFPELSKKAKDEGDAEKKENEPYRYDYLMYQKIINELAGGKFGTFNETCDHLASDILFYINGLEEKEANK